MKRIVFEPPEGGVAVVVPSPEFVARFDAEEDAVAAIIDKDVPPDAKHVCVCDEADIPADRTFRDAWERDVSPSPAPVRCDMGKARGIHMDRIREARDGALAAKDVEFMRAIEAGDRAGQARVGAEKQALRDVPQSFDLTAATTPDALKALWPAGLAGPEDAP